MLSKLGSASRLFTCSPRILELVFPERDFGSLVEVERVNAEHGVVAAGCGDEGVEVERGGHAESAAVVGVLAQEVDAAGSLKDPRGGMAAVVAVMDEEAMDAIGLDRSAQALTPAAARSISAAFSGVISRCGIPSISKPTMNFLTSAERSNGGKKWAWNVHSGWGWPAVGL